MSNSQLKTQDLSISPPDPEPDLYRSDWFTNRETETRLIYRKVEEGRCSQPIIQPLVHFWGVMGIGKSWLLLWLLGQYRFSTDEQAQRLKRTFATLIDFSKLRISMWQPASVVHFLQILIKNIQDQLDEEAITLVRLQLDNFHRNVQTVLDSQGDVSELAEKFVQVVNALEQHFVPVLLFDTAEKLDGDVFFWLESHILEPIVRRDRSVVVIAGRKEIPRWREFGTRQRLVRKQLLPFSEKETVQQLEKRGYRIGKVIYPYSFGHPYATQVLGQANDEQEFAQYLAQVETWFFLGINADQQGILRVLSTLRKFNIESARFLLGELLGNEYRSKSDVSYLRLLETLEKTNLVWWDTGQRGYILDYTVRRILNRRLQFQKAKEFVHRHAVALKLYRQWISEYTKNCGPFVREALYHLGQMWLGDRDQEEFRQRAQELLDEALNEENFATIDAANELWLALRHDEELQEAELEPLCQPILERVRVFRDKWVNG